MVPNHFSPPGQPPPLQATQPQAHLGQAPQLDLSSSSTTPTRQRSNSSLTSASQVQEHSHAHNGSGDQVGYAPLAQPFLTPEQYASIGVPNPYAGIPYGYPMMPETGEQLTSPVEVNGQAIPDGPATFFFTPPGIPDNAFVAQQQQQQQHGVDHTTPSAAGGATAPAMDDDRTPVISDTQAPIHPSALPTAGASLVSKPLLSPFKAFNQHQNGTTIVTGQQIFPSAMMGTTPDTTSPFTDPGHAYFPPMPAVPQYAYPTEMPDSAYVSPGYALPPDFSTAPMQSNVPYNGQQVYYAGPPPGFDGTFPSGVSPTSSIQSMTSLTRSHSSSVLDVRHTRPKVKLSREDKRTIIMLHRSNSSLRQEDIARKYGVDRSTISKIILSAHRWTAPEEPELPIALKPVKTVGGRFPAIEEKMSDWFDSQIASGLDVRDHVARDQAKAFAREIGFPMDRFKASAKWLDKFKDRRKMAGKPTTSSMQMYGYYPYAQPPLGMVAYDPLPSPIDGSITLSRSQSAATLSSSDSSSQEAYAPPMNGGLVIPAERMMMSTKSETDLINYEVAPTRQRSRSSPQLLDLPIMQTPSSGKAVRPSPLALQRQNSYHGTSPSPRRPGMPSRANSSQGPFRRARPGSLAASAFGITPLGGDEPGSPLISPSTSGSNSGTHSRQRSDLSLTPNFTASMNGMKLSPDISEPGDLSASTASSGMSVMPMPLAIPPHTPITPLGPGNMQNGMVPTPDYVQVNEAYLAQAPYHQQQQQQQQQHHHRAHQGQQHPHSQIQHQSQAHAQAQLHAQSQGQPQYHDPHQSHQPPQMSMYNTQPNKQYEQQQFAAYHAQAAGYNAAYAPQPENVQW